MMVACLKNRRIFPHILAKYRNLTTLRWSHYIFVVLYCPFFILEGVDLLDHTSIFLLRTINHRVIPIIRILSWFVPTGTSSEFFPPEYPPHWDIPTRSLDIPLGYGLPYRAKLCRAKFSSGETIRRAKFSSLNEKFVTFARRKVSPNKIKSVLK